MTQMRFAAPLGWFTPGRSAPGNLTTSCSIEHIPSKRLSSASRNRPACGVSILHGMENHSVSSSVLACGMADVERDEFRSRVDVQAGDSDAGSLSLGPYPSDPRRIVPITHPEYTIQHAKRSPDDTSIVSIYAVKENPGARWIAYVDL